MFFIYFAPIKAVKVAKKLENASGKEEAKRHLFFTLFAFRGNAMSQEFINALNTIDIIFQDTPQVTAAWHALRDSFFQSGLINPQLTRDLLKTDLLSKMGISLGYDALSQVDIATYYRPQGHLDDELLDKTLKGTAYQFFLIGHQLYELMIQNGYVTPKSSQVDEQQNQNDPLV